MKETFKESQEVFQKTHFGLALGWIFCWWLLKAAVCRGGGQKLSQTIRGHSPKLFNDRRFSGSEKEHTETKLPLKT